MEQGKLRDLIAASGLVILLKLDPNHQFFSPFDLKIWQMTSKNNRAPLLYHVKLCAPFQSNGWIQNLSYSLETLNLSQNRWFFGQCDLEIWPMASKDNRAPLLCYCKICASFGAHLWIQTGVAIRKQPNWGKIYFDLCDLDLWPLSLTFCMDIIITPENFMMIWWQENCEKGVTDTWTKKCSYSCFVAAKNMTLKLGPILYHNFTAFDVTFFFLISKYCIISWSIKPFWDMLHEYNVAFGIVKIIMWLVWGISVELYLPKSSS